MNYKNYGENKDRIVVVKESNGCLIFVAVLILLIVAAPFLIPFSIAAIAFLIAIL